MRRFQRACPAFGGSTGDRLCWSFNARRRAKEWMELRVVGCHGGETPKHRTSAFVVDERLAIDAGSLTSGLDLSAQFRLQACIVSHAHLDHIAIWRPSPTTAARRTVSL